MTLFEKSDFNEFFYVTNRNCVGIIDRFGRTNIYLVHHLKRKCKNEKKATIVRN